ncbi:unnamed protein product, partial [Dracunculus medinensis]|uniref:Hexosyltransferase n=1 Tax=Dracunculus medinensis TaxID=318479 RepID=A0A0N4UF08_DRAME
FQYGTRILFIVGLSQNEDINDQVKQEAIIHQDIHQINIIESYHSMTYKARSWITHLHSICPEKKISFVVKLDDDITIDLQSLIELLTDSSIRKNFVGCRLFMKGMITRNPFISREEFPFDNLGLYCQGLAYILSGDLISKMYYNIAKVQFLWVRIQL